MGWKVGTGREVVKSVSLPRTCRQSALFIILRDFPPIRLQARGLIIGTPYRLYLARLEGGGGAISMWRFGGGGKIVTWHLLQCRPIAS